MPSKLRRLHLIALLAFLAACGGDDPSGPNPDPDPDPDPDPQGEPISIEDRMEALDAVEVALASIISQEADAAEQNEAIAAYLESRPEFDEVGIDTAGSTVWAVFTDGRGLIIPNDLVVGADPLAVPTHGPSAATRARARVSSNQATHAFRMAAAIEPAELPASRQARLLSTFTEGFPFGDGAKEVRGQLETMLEDAGWDVTSGGVGASTVAALRNVRGDGFFYINTHGGRGRTFAGARAGTFALQTSTKILTQNEGDSATKADLDAGRLVYMIENYSGDPAHTVAIDKRYAITPEFVLHYMSFSENSIVFLNACQTANPDPEAVEMVQAFRTKGASVVLGWTTLVRGQHAWNGALTLVDRMTGANLYEPEPSPHRPFPLAPVLDYMTEIGADTSNGGRLQAMGPTSGAGFGLLRPTIMRVQIDTSLFAAGSMTIYGAFGSDPGDDGRVFMRAGSDVELTVSSWTPDSILVVPVRNEDQVGFWGDVVVESRGHESNPRTLHAWYGTATYVQDAPGSLQLRIDMDVVGRFDADSIRHAPGEPAEANEHVQLFRAQPYPELEASWTASGTSPWPDCGTMTWQGNGTLLSSDESDRRSYIYNAAFDPAQGELTLRTLSAQDLDGYPASCGATFALPFTFSAQMFLAQGATDPWLHYTVDDDWNVEGRLDTLAGEDATFTFQFPDMTPMPAYDPAQPK